MLGLTVDAPARGGQRVQAFRLDRYAAVGADAGEVWGRFGALPMRRQCVGQAIREQLLDLIHLVHLRFPPGFRAGMGGGDGGHVYSVLPVSSSLITFAFVEFQRASGPVEGGT